MDQTGSRTSDEHQQKENQWQAMRGIFRKMWNRGMEGRDETSSVDILGV